MGPSGRDKLRGLAERATSPLSVRLADHLDMLCTEGATGRLEVTCPDGRRGEIFLEDGAMVSASVPDMTSGPHTVAVMTTWHPVEFEWHEGARPASRPFRIAVPDLLKRIAATPEAEPPQPEQPSARKAASPAYPVRPQHWCLELVNTDRKSMRLALDKPEIHVGRGRGHDITILHPSVSRDHCTFFVEGERIRVLDLGSSNGTLVDGKPVTEALLAADSEIALGNCRFRLAYELPQVAAAPTPVLIVDFGTDATAQYT